MKQASLSLVNKTGKLQTDKKTNENGLYDIINFKTLQSKSSEPFRIVFDNEGESFACLDMAKNVTLFHFKKNRYVNLITNSPARDVTFIDVDNGYIAVALNNNSIGVYHRYNGKIAHTLKWHNFKIKGLHMNHLKGYLLSVSGDSCALWNVNNYSREKTLFSKASKFTSGIFSPDGVKLITLFLDGEVCFWNLSNFEIEQRCQLPTNGKGLKMICSLDSKYLAVGGKQGNIFICDLKQQTYVMNSFSLPQGVLYLKQMKFANNNQLCILGDNDQIYISDINLQSGFNFRTYQFNLPQSRAVLDFDITLNSKLMGIVSMTNEIYLYNYQTIVNNQKKYQDDLLSKGASIEDITRTLKPTTLVKYQKQEVIERSNIKSSEKSDLNDTLEQKLVQPNQEYIIVTNKPLESTQMTIKQFGDPNGTQAKLRPSQRIEKMYMSSQIQSSDMQFGREKLIEFLKRFKQYPDKHRALIYKQLLRLPINNEAYNNLVKKGLHSCSQDLEKKFPLDSRQTFSKLQRILSALAFYCPVFGEVEYLPAIIFPFVKLFGVDEVLCFEVVLSFLIQHCQHFFEFFPNVPMNYLQAIDDLLKKHDPQLQDHLKSRNFGLNQYIWPNLQVLFTNVISREDWLIMIDNIITYNETPELLLYYIAAYYVYFREPLLKINNNKELEIFLYRQAAVNMNKLTEKAFQMMRQSQDQDILLKFTNNLPLTKDQYPIFDFYPRYTVDYHKKIREDLLQQDRKLQQKQREINEFQNLTQNLLDLENRYTEKQKNLIKAENDRREMLLYEEEMRVNKKLQNEQDARDRRLDMIKTMESTIRSNVDQQEKMRIQEMNTMEQEIETRKKLDIQNMQARQEEEALLNLEYKAGARLNELMQLRVKEERQRRMRQELDFNNKQSQLQDVAIDQRHLQEDLALRQQRDYLNIQKMQELQQLQEENDKIALQNKLAEQAFEKEMQIKEVERERELRGAAMNDSVKNQQMEAIQQQQREYEEKENERQLQLLVQKEKENAVQSSKERINIIQQEKQIQLQEIEMHKAKLKDMMTTQKRQEFEDKINDIRKNAENRIIEEEQRLQQTLLDIDEERKMRKQLEQDLEQKQKEQDNMEAYYQAMKENEEKIKQQEREKFAQERQQIQDEQEIQLKNRQELLDQKLQDSIKTNQNELIQRSQKLKEEIQRDNVEQYENEVRGKQQIKQYPPQQSLKPNNKFSSVPNTQSLSYSISDTNDSQLQSKESMPQKDPQILAYDNPYKYDKYGSSSKKYSPDYVYPKVESISSSKQYVDSLRQGSDDKYAQLKFNSQLASDKQMKNQTQGNSLGYSSGQSTEQKMFEIQNKSQNEVPEKRGPYAREIEEDPM